MKMNAIDVFQNKQSVTGYFPEGQWYDYITVSRLNTAAFRLWYELAVMGRWWVLGSSRGRYSRWSSQDLACAAQ